MKLQEVKLTKIKKPNNKELCDNVYRVCTFCDKVVSVNQGNATTCQQLSGPKFHCPFCLRNNHHHRSCRHILPLSYRGIIGYYYHRFYGSNSPKLYFSQIEDFVKKHEYIGSQNPVFSYDNSVFVWYLDFNKIGNDRRKAPYSEVKKILNLMLDCFELKKVISEYAQDVMSKRFEKAVELFYQQRKRPKEKKMLIPTLDGIATTEKNDFFDKTRLFVKKDFILK